MGAATPKTEWHDDGTLPVDKDGSLPFYFIDAHEELATPGVVYMFGKVNRCILNSNVLNYLCNSNEFLKGVCIFLAGAARGPVPFLLCGNSRAAAERVCRAPR